jgi:hypothetical protein
MGGKTAAMVDAARLMSMGNAPGKYSFVSA